MTARTKSECVAAELEKELVYPEFYHEYGEFEGIEFT